MDKCGFFLLFGENATREGQYILKKKFFSKKAAMEGELKQIYSKLDIPQDSEGFTRR